MSGTGNNVLRDNRSAQARLSSRRRLPFSVYAAILKRQKTIQDFICGRHLISVNWHHCHAAQAFLAHLQMDRHSLRSIQIRGDFGIEKLGTLDEETQRRQSAQIVVKSIHVKGNFERSKFLSFLLESQLWIATRGSLAQRGSSQDGKTKLSHFLIFQFLLSRKNRRFENKVA